MNTKEEMISQKIAKLIDWHLSASQPCQTESIVGYIQEQFVVRFPIYGDIDEVITHVDEDEVKRVLGKMILQGLVVKEDGAYWNVYRQGLCPTVGHSHTAYEVVGFVNEPYPV